MTNLSIPQILSAQRNHYMSNQTLDSDYRIEALKKLESSIKKYEKQICEALFKDLHKSEEESYLTEIQMVYHELKLHQKKLKSWSKPKSVRTPLHLLPSQSYLYTIPLGCSLIISPWNYPFQLTIMPLIGAISSGCTAIVKPSEKSKHTSDIIAQIISETFESHYIACTTGDSLVAQELLNQRFDFIFFTGSPRIGRLVYQTAAQHMTPCVLELGGKSPCIVDDQADIETAAKRIIWGKFTNAGQTCIAPDYLLVHESQYESLVQALIRNIEKLYTSDPQASKFYGRIIDEAALNRIKGLYSSNDVLYGGKSDDQTLYHSPTLIQVDNWEHPSMVDEIFGPILPIMKYQNIESTIQSLKQYEKPLAMYYFGNVKRGEKIQQTLAAGGGCINDTLIHIANSNLPFGGVGTSGIGGYHGYRSFLAFSHQKPVIESKNWIDIPARYAPFPYFKWVKRLV